MSRVLAIDPGPAFSAYCVIDTDDYFCLECGKVLNDSLYRVIARRLDFTDAVVEGMSSYGARVGSEVFETCYAVGFSFAIIGDTLGVALEDMPGYIEEHTITRRKVKQILGLTPRATDADITRYLTDRFAPCEPNFGKGRKGAPGWFYGFKRDIWQAYALGVAYIDSKGFEHCERNRLK